WSEPGYTWPDERWMRMSGGPDAHVLGFGAARRPSRRPLRPHEGEDVPGEAGHLVEVGPAHEEELGDPDLAVVQQCRRDVLGRTDEGDRRRPQDRDGAGPEV